MYGMIDLKSILTITDSEVSCPFHDCQCMVKRQRRTFTCKPEFHCDKHEIFISPSTFEYDSPKSNILWDYDCLTANTSKRESRIRRDNSEDAVTWNVFRYLERQDLLLPYLSDLVKDSKIHLTQAKAIYWSHDRDTNQPWKWLMDARKTFELVPAKGSEPDLIVLTDKILFIIETKMMAKNNTQPSNPKSMEKYVNGGNRWWKTAFVDGADYDQIAVHEKKYELMRFWLLGTWMAKQLNVDFRLINLLRGQDEEEKDIEDRFRKFLPIQSQANFRRVTWENIYKFIQGQPQQSLEKDTIQRYFKEKTVGYRDGTLQKAFAT